MARGTFVIPALIAALSAAASAGAETADRRPRLEVVLVDRAASGAADFAAARTRARFIFHEAGIQLTFLAQGPAADAAWSAVDRIHLVLLDEAAGERLVAADERRLAFAVPPANRVYVHYDRVRALARHHGVEPGWFLGVVIAHELTHVLLPRAGHTRDGVMAAALHPDPKVMPAFTRHEAQQLRARLRDETTLVQR